ncbi:MAG: hypothetical protein NZ739_10205 [Verrucomicrobiae bacterium]|nr:hypothetical protein [Verrucomicrobiae bacterium]MCX7721930.1 hypothetical protein [Verrucomicrobiae bacterium]
MDIRIAEKLAAQPELLERAVRTLERWIQQRQPNPPPVLLEWQRILRDWPFQKILELLRSDSPEARRLRQSSPFCGILDEEERLQILRDYEAKRA